MISDCRPDPMGSESESEFTESRLTAKTMTHENNKVNTIHQSQLQQQNEEEIDNNNTPLYEKWKINFQMLLDDETGYRTFYEFLETEQISVLFECWHSCVIYRKQVPKKTTAKEIYSRFARIKDSRVPISDQARNNLALRLRANDITEKLLTEIEHEVYSNLRDICYPKFLKSDFFLFYCETFGQIQYEPSNFHKFGKPDFGANNSLAKNNLSVVEEDKLSEFSSQYCNDLQETCLTPYDKEGHLPHSSSIYSDKQSYTTNASTEDDRISMADSHFSCESKNDRDTRTMRNYSHDQLPNPVNFKPRTQRMNQDKIKQLKPIEFSALLTKKLNKVIEDRQKASHETQLSHSTVPTKHQQTTHTHYATDNNNIQNVYHEKDVNIYYDSDVQSVNVPPAIDRYSVAGASSHSGSGTNMEYQKYNRNVKEKAKGLVDAVHQSLRNGLGECNCQECYENKQHAYLYGVNQINNNTHHSRLPRNNNRTSNQCCHVVSCNCSSGTISSNTLKSSPYPNSHSIHSPMSQRSMLDHQYHNNEPQDNVPLRDTSKIYTWMEKNERYHNLNPSNTQPSPAIRRKKKSICDSGRTGLAGQPIAQDPGMPLLPQPDTGNVLEEVKRVLDEPNQRKGSSKVSRTSSSRSHHHQQQQQHQQYQQQQQRPVNPYIHDQVYNDVTYDNNSMASGGNRSLSDTQSSISYNPSQISTVPSSASRLWNENGYFDPSYLDGRSSRQSRTSHHDSHASSLLENRTSLTDSRSSHHDGRLSHHDGRSSHRDGRSSHRDGRISKHDGRASMHDSRMDQNSDARSHSSAGQKSQHSSASNSVARSDQRSNARSDHHNDAHSQSSAGRTHGSDNSRTRSSNKKQSTTVTYFFGVEPIPYRIGIPGTEVTLGQFKSGTKKGSYRFFFKTISPDDGETVYEEIKHDDEYLPKFKEQIICKIEKIE